MLYAHPDSSAATRTRPDSYSSRAFVSSHSRKLANAQTERSVAATSAVLVTESVLSSTYQHCYWMFLSRSPIATTDSRTRIDSYLSRAFVNSHSTRLPCATIVPDDLTIIILFISSLRIYARNLMMERTILVLHENVSRETSVKAIRVIINITI